MSFPRSLLLRRQEFIPAKPAPAEAGGGNDGEKFKNEFKGKIKLFFILVCNFDLFIFDF